MGNTVRITIDIDHDGSRDARASADRFIADVTKAGRDARRCATCGHSDEMHDGGIGSSWCDGNGTHGGSDWALRNRDKLCACKAFVPIAEHVTPSGQPMRLVDAREHHPVGDRPHVNTAGKFQSDKYPTCPAGKVPLSIEDASAQPFLWGYAGVRRVVDAQFSDDLEFCLRAVGSVPRAQSESERAELAELRAKLRRLETLERGLTAAVKMLGTSVEDAYANRDRASGQPDGHREEMREGGRARGLAFAHDLMRTLLPKADTASAPPKPMGPPFDPDHHEDPPVCEACGVKATHYFISPDANGKPKEKHYVCDQHDDGDVGEPLYSHDHWFPLDDRK